jgi:hypothetical protein
MNFVLKFLKVYFIRVSIFAFLSGESIRKGTTNVTSDKSVLKSCRSFGSGRREQGAGEEAGGREQGAGVPEACSGLRAQGSEPGGSCSVLCALSSVHFSSCSVHCALSSVPTLSARTFP